MNWVDIVCPIQFGGAFMAESQNIEWKESWRDEYLKWIYFLSKHYQNRNLFLSKGGDKGSCFKCNIT